MNMAFSPDSATGLSGVLPATLYLVPAVDTRRVPGQPHEDGMIARHLAINAMLHRFPRVQIHPLGRLNASRRESVGLQSISLTLVGIAFIAGSLSFFKIILTSPKSAMLFEAAFTTFGLISLDQPA